MDPLDRVKLNENRRTLFGRDGGLVAFVCECTDPECGRSVLLSVAQADDVRATQGWIVAPGHDPIVETAGTHQAAPQVHPLPFDHR